VVQRASNCWFQWESLVHSKKIVGVFRGNLLRTSCTLTVCFGKLRFFIVWILFSHYVLVAFAPATRILQRTEFPFLLVVWLVHCIQIGSGVPLMLKRLRKDSSISVTEERKAKVSTSILSPWICIDTIRKYCSTSSDLTWWNVTTLILGLHLWSKGWCLDSHPPTPHALVKEHLHPCTFRHLKQSLLSRTTCCLPS